MERYLSLRADKKPLCIKPGKRVDYTFDGTDVKDACRLHFTGETAQFYQWKSEPDYSMLYRRIDDSLCTEEAWRDQYCLKMESPDGSYPLIAYHKITFPLKLSYLRFHYYSDDWFLGISVKGDDLSLQPGGYLRFRAEIRYKKDGTSPLFTLQDPDEIFEIPLPVGTYDWQDLEIPLTFDTQKAASIALILEGEGYTGTVFAERPRFYSDSEWNLAPEFAPNSAERPQFTWFGVNLSHKEWVGLNVALNGETFFSGEIFERCHIRSEEEIPLNGAKILPEKNTLTFTVTSDYRDALAYNLFDIGLVCQPPSFVAACPDVITAGVPFAVLVETERGREVTLCSDTVFPVNLESEQDGLNVILLQCDNPQNDLKFTLKYDNQTETCTVERCVLKTEDNVLTGTGDMVYVPNEPEGMKQFLKWYFSHRIGNFITIRPTYRWCGTRSLDNDLWQKTAALLNKAGIKYAHMMDGREMPGVDANPSEKALKNPCFLGRQSHELDGAVSYWGVQDFTGHPSDDPYRDLVIRRSKTHGDTMPPWNHRNSVIEKNGRRTLYRDITVADDMEQASNSAVENLVRIRGTLPRHTGPSTLFKYFYQAGYEWTGAELMYGPQETTCAAIRGASKAYGKPIVGAHHAIQWSTTPHDSDQKNLRYRLALFGTYLQGIHHINTEEGLWHVEEHYTGFNRFSETCKKHRKQQTDFYRYVQTHSRTGEFYTPVAFLQGRYDGWDCFTRSTVWGKPSMPYAEPEQAWDTLQYFYPLNKNEAIYRHPCPNEPVGYYSGTPHGNVDIIPIEQEDYSAYPLLVALGYNKAIGKDFDKLQRYAETGGTLILGLAQCSETTNRKDVVELNHTYLNHPFRHAVAPVGDFTSDTFRGNPLTVGTPPAEATPVLHTDSRKILAYSLPVGKGTVFVINAKEYAGNTGVSMAYKEVLNAILPGILKKESVYAQGDDAVQFAIYRQPDGSSHVYFMAMDWYHSTDSHRRGTLQIGQHHYAVPAPLANPVKAVINQGVALWCNDGEGDVISVNNTSAMLQGIGRCVFTVAKDGKTAEIPVDFTQSSLQTISL